MAEFTDGTTELTEGKGIDTSPADSGLGLVKLIGLAAVVITGSTGDCALGFDSDKGGVSFFLRSVILLDHPNERPASAKASSQNHYGGLDLRGDLASHTKPFDKIAANRRV